MSDWRKTACIPVINGNTVFQDFTAVSVQGAGVKECSPPFERLQRSNGSAVKSPRGGAKKHLYCVKLARRENNHACASLPCLNAFYLPLKFRISIDHGYIMNLPLCQLRLLNDSQYPWVLLIPQVAQVKEVIDLSQTQQQQLWLESARVSHMLNELFLPDKLNVATLGNRVSQLHVHHIARYTTDPSWPEPVWGRYPARNYAEDQAKQRILAIQQTMESTT